MRAFRWSVAAGLLACGCTGPAVPRSGDPPIEAAHQSEAATPPTPAPTSVVSVAELRAIAPELTERSAARLVEAFGQSGQPADAIAEAGLMTASQGFRTFDGALMAETAGLLGESYETLTPGDRARLGTYLDHVRAGGAAPDEAREGRRLFAQAVRNLDDARRSRLTALYEQGIVAGIRYESEARARTREAQAIEAVAPPTEAGAPPSGGVASVAPVTSGGMRAGGPVAAPVEPAKRGRGEAYWRAEAQRRRARVASVEKQLAEAEAEGARYTYPPNTLARPRSGFGPPTPDPFYVKRSEINRRIAQLRVELGVVKKWLSDLDDDARRDHALPGWLR